MKVLLDTNVLIAAFIARGFCHELLEHCVRQHSMVTSDFIINEFREKLTDKFNYGSDDAEKAAALLLSKMTVVTPANLGTTVCRDPDDDNVLATAVAGNCDCLITGDKDLPGFEAICWN
ncbi:MAG TPA: putative toxin-antitoxin system toxin component, PIN family [Blastocatellia bacterium]|nr:putative toxin-antitoxin system toxin component, PIN family [Blastocatellia bacterium]